MNEPVLSSIQKVLRDGDVDIGVRFRTKKDEDLQKHSTMEARRRKYSNSTVSNHL